jgi:hypothetical protein
MMIPNLERYFRELVPTRDATLTALEEEARQEEIPIIGPVVGELLYVLALASQARQILELGTATGYSAIYLARACEVSEGRVVTLERDESMARRAQANFQEAGVEHRIEGSFLEVVGSLWPITWAFKAPTISTRPWPTIPNGDPCTSCVFFLSIRRNKMGCVWPFASEYERGMVPQKVAGFQIVT